MNATPKKDEAEATPKDEELTSKEKRAGAELAPEPETKPDESGNPDETTDENDEAQAEDAIVKDEYDEQRESELVDYHQSYGDAVAESRAALGSRRK